MSLILFLHIGLAHARDELNLFIWSEYIDPGIVREFERQFSCKVTMDFYEDEYSMMAKIQGGGASLYDVVVPPNQLVPVMVKLKLLAPLRHENLPNLTNLEDRFRQTPYDPGNRHSAPFQWGTVGLYVRSAPGKTLEPTWGLLFDSAKQAGPFVLLDTHREMIGAALKYKGFSLNSTDVNQLKAARGLLMEAKKRSLGFDGGVGNKNRILSRGAMVAVVYNGDAVRGMKEDADTQYLLPKEGSEIWVDNLVVLAKAPHRDLAEKFLNYLLDAQVGARLSNFSHYASPNKAARPFIRKEDLANPAIYPPSEMMQRLEYLEDLGDKSRLYDEVWTQVKSK